MWWFELDMSLQGSDFHTLGPETWCCTGRCFSSVGGNMQLGRILRVRSHVWLPSSSLCFVLLIKAVVSQLLALSACCHAFITILNFLSGTLNPNKCSLLKVSLFIVFYHSNRNISNIEGKPQWEKPKDSRPSRHRSCRETRGPCRLSVVVEICTQLSERFSPP